MIVPLLLALAADPSPSLEAIVNLGRGTPPAAEASTSTAPAPALAETTSTKPALTTMPAASSTPFPWAATGAVALMGAGAFGLWWRKRQTVGGRERALRLDDSLALGRDRALVVCEIDGRRFLLASTPAGVNLLADLGVARTPTPLVAYAPPLAPPPQDDAFALALERELAPVTTSLTPAPLSPPAPAAAPPATKAVDVEGQEIQRRLRLLGQNGPHVGNGSDRRAQ